MMVKAAPRFATILCLNQLETNCHIDITYRWLGSYGGSVLWSGELGVAYIGNANRGGSLGGSHDEVEGLATGLKKGRRRNQQEGDRKEEERVEPAV